MNVLLCEDDPSYAETVQFMFTLFAPDDTVYHVQTLSAALALLVHQPPIDVILLDLNLPDAKNLQALTAMSATAADIPIIVLTAYPMWRDQAMEIGAKAYKVKSDISGEALVDTVHMIVHEEL